MTMKDQVKIFLQTSKDRVQKATGKSLGDEDMPATQQVEELKVHLKNAGNRVVKSTGKALGDEDMPLKGQIDELKGHLKVVSEKVRDQLKKTSSGDE